MSRIADVAQEPLDEPVGAFALRLCRLMDERGFSQNDLARRLGMDRSQAVWRWANAQVEPSYSMLRRLRVALDCTYDDLFGCDELETEVAERCRPIEHV